MSLADLPSEVLTQIAGFLDQPTDVAHLMQTCRTMRDVCVQEENLWRRLLHKHKNLTFKLPSLTWREQCLSDTSGVCRHLNELDGATGDLLSKTMAGAAMHNEGQACKGESCSVVLPDLWVCLHPDCGNVGCGRYKREHGLRHFARSEHPLAIKPRTMFLYCYVCLKWVGSIVEPELEQHRMREILISLFPDLSDSKHAFWAEMSLRMQHRLTVSRGLSSDPKKMYLVHPSLRDQFDDFILGNCVRPPAMESRGQANLAHRFTTKTFLTHGWDYCFTTAESWELYRDYYGVQPEIRVDWALASTRSQDTRNHLRQLLRGIEERPAAIHL